MGFEPATYAQFVGAVHANTLLTPRHPSCFVTREEPSESKETATAGVRAFGWLGGSPGVNPAFRRNATTGFTLIVLSNYDPLSAEELRRICAKCSSASRRNDRQPLLAVLRGLRGADAEDGLKLRD